MATFIPEKLVLMHQDERVDLQQRKVFHFFNFHSRGAVGKRPRKKVGEDCLNSPLAQSSLITAAFFPQLRKRCEKSRASTEKLSASNFFRSLSFRCKLSLGIGLKLKIRR